MSYLCRERVSTAHCFSDYVTNYVTPSDDYILDAAKWAVNNLPFTKKQSASPDLTDAIAYALYFSETSTSSFYPVNSFFKKTRINRADRDNGRWSGGRDARARGSGAEPAGRRSRG